MKNEFLESCQIDDAHATFEKKTGKEAPTCFFVFRWIYFREIKISLRRSRHIWDHIPTHDLELRDRRSIDSQIRWSTLSNRSRGVDRVKHIVFSSSCSPQQRINRQYLWPMTSKCVRFAWYRWNELYVCDKYTVIRFFYQLSRSIDHRSPIVIRRSHDNSEFQNYISITQ